MQSSSSEFIIERGENREITLTPKSAPVEYSLIWLPGMGDTAEGVLPIFESNLRPTPNNFRVRILTAPVAPVRINNDLPIPRWYNVFFIGSDPKSINFEDVLTSSAYIQSVIKEEIQQLGGDPSRVFIAGFSQGCAMALHNAIVTEIGNLGGVIALSGYLFPQTQLRPDTPPVLICHGEDDPVIAPKLALFSYTREGFYDRENVQYCKIPRLGHDLNRTVLALIEKFLLDLTRQ